MAAFQIEIESLNWIQFNLISISPSFRSDERESASEPTKDSQPVCLAPVFDEIGASNLTPNQPRDFEFPKSSFGLKQRSFQPDWFKNFKWLHYDQTKDAAFCFTCVRALKKNMISSEKSEKAFTETGYRNWKKALETNRGFSKHECSTSHKEATERLITAPKTC